MYQLSVTDGNRLDVHYKNLTISYGESGVSPNPLEATYAALTGCAGVYTRKACKAMDISPNGIEINCKPVVNSSNPLVPKRFVTEVSFPESFTSEQRERVLQEVGHCAVKLLINEGDKIEFVTAEATAVCN